MPPPPYPYREDNVPSAYLARRLAQGVQNAPADISRWVILAYRTSLSSFLYILLGLPALWFGVPVFWAVLRQSHDIITLAALAKPGQHIRARSGQSSHSDISIWLPDTNDLGKPYGSWLLQQNTRKRTGWSGNLDLTVYEAVAAGDVRRVEYLLESGEASSMGDYHLHICCLLCMEYNSA